jgi:hypothetical protein
LVGGKQKLPWGDVRERGEATGEKGKAGQHGRSEKEKITAVKGYLYPKGPECPDQVQSFRETRILREIIRSFRSP